MKKFLSILLALAVGFTFTFGSAMSAFGATGAIDADTYAKANVSKVYEAVKDAQDKATAAVVKTETDALYSIFGAKTEKDFDNLTVTYDQVKKYYDEVVATKETAITAEASNIYSAIQVALNDPDTEYIRITESDGGKWDNGDKNGYNIVVKFTTTASASDFTALFSTGDAAETKAKDVAKDAYAAMVTDKLAEIAAVDPASYIAKDQEAVKTLKAKATKQVTQLGNKVANGSFTFEAIKANGSVASLDADVTSAITGFAGMLSAIYVPAKNEAVATGVLATELAKLTLSADEPTQAAKLAWARTQILDRFETAVKAEYDAAITDANKTLLNESLKGNKADQTKIDAANETIENAKSTKDAAMEIATYLVNNCDDLSKLITEATPFANSTVKFGAGAGNWNYASGTIASPLITAGGVWYYGNVAKVAEYVSELKEEAAALKADIAIDGTTAVDVDALLKDAIDATYKTGVKSTLLKSYTADDSLHARQHALAGTACSDNGSITAKATVEINKVNYTTVDNWSESAYEDARLEEVKNIKKETKKAIMAATSVADAEAAFLAGLDKYKAVLTIDNKALNQASKTFVDLKAKYVQQLSAEIDYAIAGLNAVSATENKVGNGGTYKTTIETELAEAYTTDELTEIFNKLQAEVKELKGKTKLDAEKTALEDRCKAYSNVTVTAADKDALTALRNDVAAFRTYATRTGNGYVVADYGLNNKVVAVMQAEKKAIEDQYKVINKDGKATLDEADAVSALRKAVTDYNKTWDAFIEELEEHSGITKTALSVANLGTFENQISAAQIKAVEEMIAKLPADGSDVAGIKAAREAYDALTLCQKVTVENKYYDKLSDLEKLVKFTAEDAKAYVQDLAIAVRTAKVGKKVKVTAKADVQTLIDNGYTVEYKFYKSTKKGSGYKNTVNKTTNTYTNTNPVKGKNYYKVKLVVKNADGAVVATTPLTQCKYGVRTIK